MMNKKIIAFIFIASLVLLSACSKKRPEMSYHKIGQRTSSGH